jgi:voltage-gated potassium channel
VKKKQQKKSHKLHLAKELVVFILVLTSVFFWILQELGKLNEHQIKLLDGFEVGLAILFLTEFFSELYFSKNKKSYLWHNWYYLLAAIPFPSNLTDALRTLRLIRIVKLIRYGLHVEHEGYKALH